MGVYSVFILIDGKIDANPLLFDGWEALCFSLYFNETDLSYL